MKKIFFALTVIAGLLLFTGCPVATKYTLSTPGSEKIDAKLIGTWQTLTTDAPVLKIKVERADNYSYNVTVIDKGDLYTVDETQFKGYIANFEGNTFFYLFDDVTGDYFLQHYRFDGRQVVVSDVSLKVGGVDACTSNETYRAEVKASMKFTDFLGDPIAYTKQ